METKTLDQRIESRAGVLGGKPCIAGRRIAVQNIVVWHEHLGWSVDRIASEYDLDLADIHAALAYYFAHRSEIDKTIEEGRAFVEEMRRQTPSLLQRKLRGEVG